MRAITTTTNETNQEISYLRTRAVHALKNGNYDESARFDELARQTKARAQNDWFDAQFKKTFKEVFGNK